MNGKKPLKILDPDTYMQRVPIEGDYIREALFHAMYASQKAYAPYSKFVVGAAVVTSRGTIFSGCNVENASYGITICAERNAISTMIAHLGPAATISKVVIYTPTVNPSAPCGACRQVIREFAFNLSPTMVYSFAVDPNTPPLMRTIDQLLPNSFGPENL